MQQKRKVQDPKVIELVENYVDSFHGITSITTFAHIIVIKELPFDDDVRLSFTISQMNAVLTRTIASGDTHVEGKTERTIIDSLIKLRKLLMDNTCLRYRELRMYQLTGEFARWSPCSLLFHICSLILVILNHLTRDAFLIPLDEKKLAELCVLMYPRKKIRDYTQIELRTAIKCLAYRWSSLNYDPVLSVLLDHLNMRAAMLCVSRNTADILDGKEGVDKFKAISHKAHNPNDKLIFREYSCSPDYISDLASMITHMRVSIFQREMITDQIIAIQDSHKWEGYDPKILEAGFKAWIKAEVAFLEGQKFKEDLREIIMQICALKSGDYERYMRENSGRTAVASVVVEYSGTPLQGAFWTSTSLRGGIPKLIEDPNISIRSIAILQAFHHACKTKSQFNWRLYCFISENELISKFDNLKRQRAPIVIKQLGEFNLWYMDKIYRTRTIEKALILWTLTMVYHLQCEFKDTKYQIQKLECLEDFVRTWNNGRLNGEQSARPMDYEVDENEIFCDVLDPMFLDKV